MIIKHKLDGEVGERVRQLHDSPTALYYRGTDPNILLRQPSVAIVGSRKMTPYGKMVTEQLTKDLVRAGVVIISGLAFGVDAASHTACLAAGGKTIAVLPSSPDKIYPASHLALSHKIIEQGGTLISEYGEATPAMQHTFIARNRIIAACADAVLIPEAALKSGSLHTADFALDLGKPVLAVPGPITSAMSAGTNQLIKNGALPVTGANDVLEALGINQQQVFAIAKTDSPEEARILDAVSRGVHDGLELLRMSKLDSRLFLQTISLLEIKGYIRAIGNDQWAVA